MCGSSYKKWHSHGLFWLLLPTPKPLFAGDEACLANNQKNQKRKKKKKKACWPCAVESNSYCWPHPWSLIQTRVVSAQPKTNANSTPIKFAMNKEKIGKKIEKKKKNKGCATRRNGPRVGIVSNSSPLLLNINDTSLLSKASVLTHESHTHTTWFFFFSYNHYFFFLTHRVFGLTFFFSFFFPSKLLI